jgi:hypothetical protein
LQGHGGGHVGDAVIGLDKHGLAQHHLRAGMDEPEHRAPVLRCLCAAQPQQPQVGVHEVQVEHGQHLRPAILAGDDLAHGQPCPASMRASSSFHSTPRLHPTIPAKTLASSEGCCNRAFLLSWARMRKDSSKRTAAVRPAPGAGGGPMKTKYGIAALS